MKNVFMVIFLALTANYCFSQSSLTVQSIYSQKDNTNVLVAVNVLNMVNIAAISLNIKYDTTVLKFNGIKNPYNGMGTILTNSVNGIAKIGWIDWTGGSSPLSITNDKLFDLDFSYVANFSKLEVVQAECEFYDNNNKKIQVEYSDGLVTNVINSVENNPNAVNNFSLVQNYPNPFNPETKINFSLAERASVNITVYNMLGERVECLLDKELNAGLHEVTFRGNNIPSGIYVYKINAGRYSAAKKMILQK